MANLGYVGLGVMGGRMAKRLLDAGHTVVGHNRTRSKAQWLIEGGMRWAGSPREVAEKGDVVFSMVTNTAAVNAITSGSEGILEGLSELGREMVAFGNTRLRQGLGPGRGVVRSARSGRPRRH